MIIEPAQADDLAEVIAMRQEASDWLRERGIDQWSKPWPDHDGMVTRISASIAAGETWMIRTPDDGTVATVALDTYADPRLWTPLERQEPALYLHRLIVRRSHAGLGSHVLNWACKQAAKLSKQWVRIDVWTHNEPLHRYYLANGFQHVRTLNLSDYPSSALFQRPAGG